MQYRYLRILCIGLAIAIFLVGCGGSPVPVTSKTPLPTNQTTVPTASPTPTSTPDPLPADVVVYPGAQLVVAQRITTGTLYFYRSTAALQAVTTFYIDQMPKHGWTQESAELNGSQGNFLVYIKDTRSVILNIVPDPITPAQTDISVTLSNN
jgi:hypothetical protein